MNIINSTTYLKMAKIIIIFFFAKKKTKKALIDLLEISGRFIKWKKGRWIVCIVFYLLNKNADIKTTGVLLLEYTGTYFESFLKKLTLDLWGPECMWWEPRKWNWGAGRWHFTLLTFLFIFKSGESSEFLKLCWRQWDLFFNCYETNRLEVLVGWKHHLEK